MVLQPEDGGLKPVPRGALRRGAPEDNARLLLGLLEGRASRRGSGRLNAGAALWVAEAGQRAQAGRVAESIDSGAARTRLERLVALTRAGVAAYSRAGTGESGGHPAARWQSWSPAPSRTARDDGESDRRSSPRSRAGREHPRFEAALRSGRGFPDAR